MSQSDVPVVAIVKCADHASVEAVKPQARRACDLVGGLKSLIMPGDTVLLKPNLVVPRPYTSGATTNPFLVEAMVELCREAGAKRVVIGEGSCVGVNTLDAFAACGYNDVAKRQHCELVDFTKDETVTIVNPLAKKMKRIRLPKTFMDANVVIDLAVTKTHDVLEASLGLKNMKGLLQTNDKKRFHKWGLEQSLVDLAHIALPDLTILDGTIGMEGAGPAAGDAVGLGLLLASKDTVAVDTVACEVMGFTLDEVGYIRMAGEAGLGCCELDEIEIEGETIAEVRHPFARTSIDAQMLAELGITLAPCDACSGCANAITNTLLSFQRNGRLEELRDSVLLYGQSVERLPEQEVRGRRVIRIGSCTRSLSDYGVYVPGCPPFLYGLIDELAAEEGRSAGSNQ